MIYPPPEVRNMVDKTAAFVARNGIEFAARYVTVQLPSTCRAYHDAGCGSLLLLPVI